MSGITHDYMENYLRSLIKEETGVLKEIKDYGIKNSIPIVQKETAQFLKFIVSMKKPLKILELGTAIGYSSILMYTESSTNPEVTTIERDERMIAIAEDNISKYNLEEKIKVLKGDCLDILENLQDKYDLIFMDAGKGHYNHFLPHCLRLLKDDGIIVADNVLFRGMVASQSLVKRRKITIVKRMRTYLEMVSEDDNLITSIIPMGDGIAITKRR